MSDTRKQDHKLAQEMAQHVAALKSQTHDIGRQQHHAQTLIERLEQAVSELNSLKNKPHTKIRERILETLQQLRDPKKWWSLVWKLSSAAALLFGLFASVYDLRPKISVSVADMLDPDDPFTTMVTVSNDGSFPIYNVHFYCGVRLITVGGPENPPIPDWQNFSDYFSPNSNFSFLSYTPIKVAPIIRSGQKATALNFCGMKGHTLRYADIALVVVYRQRVLERILGDQRKIFRLVTVKREDGKLMWMQQP